MWRMLRALGLDLAMSKECGVDTVFQYWHDKNIYLLQTGAEDCHVGREMTGGYALHVSRRGERKLKQMFACRFLGLCPNLYRAIQQTSSKGNAG